MNLDIIYKDECLLVVNKPAGIPVHATHDPLRANLQGVLAKQLASELQHKPVLHHRLDRDTSGLVLFGIDPAFNKAFTDMFRDRLVKKTYLAVVDGSWSSEWTSVETYIDKVAGGRYKNFHSKKAAPKKAKEAVTKFKVLDSNADKSFLEVSPQTGRTHQIRLHCQDKGHSILGDLIYHPSKQKWRCPMALHAWKLEFVHPLTGETLALEAPVPEFWQNHYLQGLSPSV